MQHPRSSQEATAFNQNSQISSGIGLQLPALTRPVNVLVLGTKVLTSDVQTPTTQADGYHQLVNSLDGLADTILLLRFDPEVGSVTVLSIPRDTRTWIEGHGVTKINAANAYGGPALSATAVSDLLDGIGIDRYVRINVQGVEKLVDALDGVTVNVPKDLKYQDDSQHLYINLKAGEQRLNGAEALQFLRFRYGELGDIGRVKRQQLFMQAFLKQTLKPSTVTRLPEILSVIQSHLDTNLNNEELLAFANFAMKVERSQVQMLMVPGRFSAPGEYDASYWIPDSSQIQTLVTQYFDHDYGGLQAADPASLRIVIQGGMQSRGVIDMLVNRLMTSGYNQVSVDERSDRSRKVTRIVAQKGDRDSANAIRHVLGIGKVRVESTEDLYSDVTIKLGQDWSNHQMLTAPQGDYADSQASEQS